MTAMHPNEDFCASRGMTLDAVTKQCVSPAKPPAAAAEVTGSIPSGDAKAPQQSQPQVVANVQPTATPASSPRAVRSAPATPAGSPPAIQAGPLTPPASQSPPPPTPPQRRTASLSIEPGAAISQRLMDTDLMSELALFVRASGYRCESISALQLSSESQGYRLACNRSDYKYAIDDKDGRWIVTAE